MIDSAPYYWLVCDGCKERADYDEYSAWENQGAAVDAAVGSEWTVSPDGQQHHCPGCPPLDVEPDAAT